MNRIKLLAALLVIGAIILGTAMIFVPLPEGTQTRTGLFTQLGFSASMFVLFTGSAIIFLLGLKNFTDKLKKAYGVLCAGIVLISLAQLQVPLFTALNMMDTFWVRGGPIVLPFISGVVAIYLGVRAIGRLFGARGPLMSVWFFFASTIAASIVLSFFPHAATPTPEVEFDASTVLPAWTDFAMIVSVGVVILTKQRASTVYTEAFTWLIRGLGTLIFISLTYVVMAFTLGDKHWLVMDGYIYAYFTIAGIALVRAAYAFYAIPEQVAVTKQQTVTSVDIVTYAASLVSRTEDIDSLLDEVRFITARSDINTLSDKDTATLKDTYLKIEDYLLTREPVRKFDRPSLRSYIQRKLRLEPSSPTFWKELALG